LERGEWQKRLKYRFRNGIPPSRLIRRSLGKGVSMKACFQEKRSPKEER